MAVLLVIACAFVLTESTGYLIHWFAHKPKSRTLFKIHLIHHYIYYPAARFLTDEYRGGLRNSFVPFFVPGFICLALLGWWLLPLQLFLVAVATMSLVAGWNSWIHDTYHIRDHWMKRFAWHRRWTHLHYRHHQKVQKNLGLYIFTIDRIRGKFLP